MSKIACHAEVEEKEPNTLKIKRTLTAHKKKHSKFTCINCCHNVEVSVSAIALPN